MTLLETWNEVIMENPMLNELFEASTTIISNLIRLFNPAFSPRASTGLATAGSMEDLMKSSLWKIAGPHHHFVRLAGLGGATALLVGVVGNQSIDFSKDKGEVKQTFNTANSFHLFHSFALLGVPLAKYPYLSGTLMVAGMVLFSGPLYRRVFANDDRFVPLARLGGVTLTVAWLSLLL